MQDNWNRPYMGDPEPDVIALKKCKFCGESLNQTCYPRYSGSDTVSHMCTNNKCGAHYYGKRPGPYRWWTKEEWYKWINGEDEPTFLETQKRAALDKSFERDFK